MFRVPQGEYSCLHEQHPTEYFRGANSLKPLTDL